MDNLVGLLKSLEARHAEFLKRNWASLSADDAKRFTQIERDILVVQDAIGTPQAPMTAELQGSIDRLRESLG